MTKLLGIILIVLGIVVGLYVGLYFCLYGGIVQIINGIKDSLSAGPIAIGVVRVLCTGVAGWVSALLLIIPGIELVQK